MQDELYIRLKQCKKDIADGIITEEYCKEQIPNWETLSKAYDNLQLIFKGANNG
jgi:hypothetical protein